MSANVSIILSIYNSGNSVKKTIQSILNQDYKSFELIIINDGSTDNTKKILAEYKKQNKIRIFNFDCNLGLASRLNFGLSKSISNYILRVDDNDLIPKKRIRFQLNQLKKYKNLDIIGGCALYIDGSRKKKVDVFTKDNEIKNQMKFYNPLIHSSVMFKKKSILKLGGYNESFRRCQDYELWLRGKHKLNFKNSKKIFVTRDISNFKFDLSNVFFLFKARIMNLEYGSKILSFFLLFKDFFIYLFIKLHLKKII